MPPGVPAERVEALREAFAQTLEDPDFLAEAEQAGRPINLLRGERMEEMYQAVFNISEEDAQRIRVILLGEE